MNMKDDNNKNGVVGSIGIITPIPPSKKREKPNIPYIILIYKYML